MPRQYDQDMNRLEEKLLTMAATAESMIHDTVTALVERQLALFDPVKANEDKMDRLQCEVDEETIRLVAVYTPVAADLRLLLMTTRIATELERIGDLTVDISFYAKTLFKEPPLKPFVDLPSMAEIAMDMLRRALDAFVEHSGEKALAVVKTDDMVDDLHDQFFKELMTKVLAAPETVTRVMELVLMTRAFERIADHAVNIAEDVIYVIKGEDIRHHHEDDEVRATAR